MPEPPQLLADGDRFLEKRSYVGQLRGHHVNHLKERTLQRRSMMRWTLGLATAIIVVSTAAMGAYLVSEWRHLAAAVMVGWFSSVVAQVLGLVYVVALICSPKMIMGSKT